ncbi:MAG: Respiratory nitrate reductase 1 beta chain [Candidatus Heimdallarchaeota archaeon LC_2]|nr:MAG: Respiratory nitrate reductase 1 beta chain [Candidatus Heimdallarchaeota archaeon LC_2]
MNIKAQISMVFHLDKCIGCHTCSIACKNIWTDRKGTEYMWWNNVETKPGVGYPKKWEDQKKYKGGFKRVGNGKNIILRASGRLTTLTTSIFGNRHLPELDDYYEPWTYRYEDLFDSPQGDDQPTARPISLITGKPMDINYGPNWDDDLGGSEEYAAKDMNLEGLTDEEKAQLKEIERLVFFYLPRICNHCTNAGCVAACPQGAIYKRGEDGIVLVSQEKCRAWRMCITGCPYKKVYYNWGSGKSEKCILCFPRLETGQAPACFHSCVGRIRYMGVLLYDADEVKDAVKVEDMDLVEAQRAIIKDPFDPEVIEACKRNRISPGMLEAAQNSPVYKFVKKWKIALPLHPEFRTMPMLFYVPPLLPIIGRNDNGVYNVADAEDEGTNPHFSVLEKARLPIKFMANLFTAGNEDLLKEVFEKLIAVRQYRSSVTTKGRLTETEIQEILEKGKTNAAEANDIFHLSSKPTYEERFVIPPLARERSIEQLKDPHVHKQEAGFGFKEKPDRRW